MQTNDLKSHFKNTQAPEIAVFRALQIGDLLCAIPAIRALKTAFPKSKITLIGLPWSQEFVKRFTKYFDDFLEFPGFPGLPERPFQPTEIVKFIQDVQTRQFDLNLQMQGSGSIVNPLIELLAAKLSAGFHEREGYKPSNWYMEYPDTIHEIRRHLKLMRFLGVPAQSEDLEFPISDQEMGQFYERIETWKIAPQDYICFHVGSKSPDRRWRIENFAQVADFVVQQGYKVVLTGSGEEQELIEQAASLMQYPSLNLAGQTSLGVAGALIKHARLLISNDTGVSHIACALKVPSVIIFSASDPQRWAPLNTNLHKRILKEQATVREVISQTRKQLGIKAPLNLSHYQGAIAL